MSRTADEEGCPVYNDALIEEKKMTKEDRVIEAARSLKEFCESIDDCDYCIFALQNGKCRMQWITPQDWLIPSYKTENSPSDARKGDGWSTISVDENVGSNAVISAADAIVKMGEAFDLFAKATADMVRNKE